MQNAEYMRKYRARNRAKVNKYNRDWMRKQRAPLTKQRIALINKKRALVLKLHKDGLNGPQIAKKVGYSIDYVRKIVRLSTR